MKSYKNYPIKLSILTAVFILLSLPGCPSHWQGDSAKLFISFSGAGRAAYDPKDSETHRRLDHRVILTNGAETLNFSFKAGTALEALVAPGNWNVRVDSWQETDIYATGSKDVVLRFGQNNETIQMFQGFLVTFDSNDDSGIVLPVIARAGESITLPEAIGLIKVDYVFNGWSTNPDGTEKNYAAGSTYVVEGNVTLYAIFKDPSEKAFTITQVINNNLSMDNNGSVTLTITEDFDSYEWFKGVTKLGEGKSVTLMANNPAFVQGYNWITAVVYTGEGTIPWSGEFVIYVNN